MDLKKISKGKWLAAAVTLFGCGLYYALYSTMASMARGVSWVHMVMPVLFFGAAGAAVYFAEK